MEYSRINPIIPIYDTRPLAQSAVISMIMLIIEITGNFHYTAIL